MTPFQSDDGLSAQEQEQARLFGVSNSHWKGLSEKDRAMYALVRPLRNAAYKVDYPLPHVESMLSELESAAQQQGGSLQLDPDFQRGHVWSQARQEAFVENVLRGVAPVTLRFNSAGWNGDARRGSDLNAADCVCVDGLQRLTAVRRFMQGDIHAFGLPVAAFKDTPFDPRRFRLNMEVFTIDTRVELLRFYLALNRGGVVHAEDEIARVERLLQQAIEEASGGEKALSNKKARVIG